MEAIRTSGDLANGENWADVTSETTDSSTTVSTWNPSAGKVTVTSSKKKIVTIKKTTNAAKKISVKVKARKKGKAIITVKAGKKHAKTIVKVK